MNARLITVSVLALALIIPARADDAPASSTDPAPPSDAPQFKVHPAGPLRYDRAIRDSKGTAGVRPVPAAGELPSFFAQVDLLRKNKDEIGAADYLRLVIKNGDILPQYRARAMLMLADSLSAQGQPGEALCWLRLWMQLYPMHLEAGAVAYRMGTLYKQMGLPELARDAYYLALAHSVNEGQVNNDNDLAQYTRLTVGTLWAMAANEYESGQWDRAAQLFQRFQKEAPSASPVSLENAAFLQADSYYQLKQVDKAIALYEDTLQKHPFNPLAPQARLRLYHLDVIQNQPQKAHEELEAFIWTVRTAFPAQETYWQKQTAEMLLALNRKDAALLPPLLEGSTRVKQQGKTWQDALNHYDALVGYQAAKNAIMDPSGNATPLKPGHIPPGITEQAELALADRELNQLLPPAPAP